MERNFKQWLLVTPNENGKVKAESTAYSYAKAITKISEHYSDIIKKPIDLYFDREENRKKLTEIIPLYDRGGSYEDIGKVGNYTYINALKNYSSFLEYFSENEDAFVTDVENEVYNESSFRQEQDLKDSLVNQIDELFPKYRLYNGQKAIEYKLRGDKRIDVLLENKQDGNLLIVELKAGKATFSVLGQVAMYIRLLKEKIPNKHISACIIGGSISEELRLATQITDLVQLKSYDIKLKLNCQNP